MVLDWYIKIRRCKSYHVPFRFKSVSVCIRIFPVADADPKLNELMADESVLYQRDTLRRSIKTGWPGSLTHQKTDKSKNIFSAGDQWLPNDPSMKPFEFLNGTA